MSKFKNALMALAAASLMTLQAQANEDRAQSLQAMPAVTFSQADIHAMFEQSGQSMQLAALSDQEMKETEGAFLWFAPIAFQFGRVFAGRIMHHSAHHTFGSLGRLPHLQMNFWRPGVSGSGGVFRIPLPNTSFFRP
jgi:hypothetical protein